MEEIKIWLRSIYDAGVYEGDYNKYEAEALKAIHRIRQDDREALIEAISDMTIEVVGNSSATVDQIIELIKQIPSR